MTNPAEASAHYRSRKIEDLRKTLKRCPFCGGAAVFEDTGWPHHVYCEACGARVMSFKYGLDGEDDAIAKWNSRAGGESEQGIYNHAMEG